MIEPLKMTNINAKAAHKKEKYINMAMAGDKAAYSNLILGMENKLYRISRSVLRDDADCADAIQEALIRAWLKLPELRDPALFEHWLVRILLRECYRIAKKIDYYDTQADVPSRGSTDPTQRLALEEAVYKLKPEHRTPLILHHMMGYKVHEIAKMLAIPEGTVKSRLLRARRKLKSIIQGVNL
jgi:RNA polymerase sigma-70 factor (ECF subfamily)